MDQPVSHLDSLANGERAVVYSITGSVVAAGGIVARTVSRPLEVRDWLWPVDDRRWKVRPLAREFQTENSPVRQNR